MIGWKRKWTFLSHWSHIFPVFLNGKKRLSERSSGTSSMQTFCVYIFKLSYSFSRFIWNWFAFLRKLKLHLLKQLVQFQVFWKTHPYKLIPNWTWNRMITQYIVYITIPQNQEKYRIVCSSKTYSYFPHRRSWNFLGTGGFCKTTTSS